MATIFKHDCGHCQTKSSAFSAIAQRPLPPFGEQIYLFASCGVCYRASLFFYEDIFAKNRSSSKNLIDGNHDFPGDEFFILKTWPSFEDDVPDHVPENVQNFYRQAQKNKSDRNWDAAGAMFRKALDVATKFIDPTMSNKSLYNRIDSLKDGGKITEDIAEWAHAVRLDGNDAVHGDEPETQQDVESMHRFCRAFLMYVFTLPAMVKARGAA